jgi:hypothetical protein
MVTTVETKESLIAHKANCLTCLTRSCPMNGVEDFPVTLCNTFRQANCAFCAVKECPLNGTINSPVLDCSSFKLLGAA